MIYKTAIKIFQKLRQHLYYKIIKFIIYESSEKNCKIMKLKNVIKNITKCITYKYIVLLTLLSLKVKPTNFTKSMLVVRKAS